MTIITAFSLITVFGGLFLSVLSTLTSKSNENGRFDAEKIDFRS